MAHKTLTPGRAAPELPAATVSRPSCGTYAGMQAHNHHGEMACGPCLRANAAYMRSWRNRGKCARGLGWPL